MLPFLIWECLTRADTVRPLRTLKEIRGLDRMFQFFRISSTAAEIQQPLPDSLPYAVAHPVTHENDPYLRDSLRPWSLGD